MFNYVKSKKNFVVKSVVLVFVLVLMILIGSTYTFAQQTSLTLVSGGTGGTWYTGGACMAEIWNSKVPDLYVTCTDGATLSNIKVVDKGTDAQIGMAWSAHFYDALELKGLFAEMEEPPKIKAMMNFYKNWGPYWIATKKSGIKSIRDFGGKKILPGYAGSGMEYSCRELLSIGGSSYEEIEKQGGKVFFADYVEAANLMKDGHIDAFSLVGPYRHSVALEAQNYLAINVFGIPEDAGNEFIKRNKGYLWREIHAGTYEGQDEPVKCLGYHGILIVNENLKEEIVYQILKTLFENKELLVDVAPDYKFVSLENALIGIECDQLHSGAQKYFAEQGLGPK